MTKATGWQRAERCAAWQWPFVEALWVRNAWRHPGHRSSAAQADAHAVAAPCYSAWLDTFQARSFYLVLGYQQFGVLDGYPPGQTRNFLCRRLVVAMEAPSP